MCTFPIHLSRGLGLLLGAVVMTVPSNSRSSAAESASPSVHRIAIVEGGRSHVQYVASGNLSTSDRLALSDLQRAENELNYVNDLHELKYQYVRSERSLEPVRRLMQERLFGRRISSGNSNSIYASYAPNYFAQIPGTGYNTFYGGPYGYGGYGNRGAGLGYGGGSSYSETYSLQYGMGNEGRMKNALIGVIAQQATADYAAAAIRNYKDAVDRAANSSILSRDLGLKKSAETPPPAKPTKP